MEMTILDTLGKIETIDRRVWYVLLLVMISVPLIRPIGLPIEIEPETMLLYNYINDLPAGSSVVYKMSGASSIPEKGPVQLAVLKHLISRDLKILFMFGTASEVDIAITLDTYYLPRVQASPKYGPLFAKKVYGVDYIVLPYVSGGTQAQAAFAGDALLLLAGMTDYYDRGKINDYPIMQYFKSAFAWDFLITTSGEPATTQEIQIYQAPYGVPMTYLSNAMHWATHKPYRDSGQFTGGTNGLRGGAEYELLIGEPTAAGLGGMDAFSVTYVGLWIILIWANIAYFGMKRKRVKV